MSDFVPVLSSSDLEVGKERWIGPSHGQFCHRYLLREDGLVEKQNIYRYGKPGKTEVMTKDEFDAYLLKFRQEKSKE